MRIDTKKIQGGIKCEEKKWAINVQRSYLQKQLKAFTLKIINPIHRVADIDYRK